MPLCIWQIHYIQEYTPHTHVMILTYTQGSIYGMYTIYRNIHHIHTCIHDDTDIYPSVYGIYTIYRYIHHIHS